MTEEEKKKSKLNISATQWFKPPKGYYCIGTYQIVFDYKPNVVHRLFMRLLLGFKWRDA